MNRGGRNCKRAVIVVAIAVAAAAFRIFHLGDYLTISHIRESQEQYRHLYAGHGLSVIAFYIAVYVLTTSLSLPGAAILTIAGGALFGLPVGTVIVSFASSIGATAACLVSRFVMRDWVQKKFGDRLRTVNEGIEREGAFYLFTLRLIPVFPFWLINLVMGLTKMPLRTFYWVSQAGMLPATIVYVNTGRELARISSISGILSPRLVISFALLGIFPIAAKKSVDLYRRKKAARSN